MSKSLPLAVFLTALALVPCPVFAQISVSGVEDEEVYADRVVFSVDAEAGFDYAATLNDAPVAVEEPVEITRADYYQLVVRRTADGTDDTEELFLHFIVRSSSRGTSENGIPTWTPLPPIPSSAEEFAGATLAVYAPAAFPVGRPLPVVAWLRDAEGARVGANGAVIVEGAGGAVSLRLLRGVGSVELAAFGEPGERTLTADVATASASRVTVIEAEPEWDVVSGEIASDTEWPAGARVRVAGDLEVPEGVTLTVGAGAVVVLAAEVEVAVDGRVVIDGTAERPVAFVPDVPGEAWGGIVLEGASAAIEARATFFTGAGADPDWFDAGGRGSSHRDEQPLFFLRGGATADLEDVWVLDLAGQAGHGEDGFLTMRRSLIQRCITAGQYNGGVVDLTGCALIEFPAWDAPFEDEDNDALYMTGGAHVIRDSLVGWALDDGLDAGSGSGGSVDVVGCWIEACYHDALAWSESRVATVRDTVILNSGQGIECGFGDPQVDVARCLSTQNVTGLRFGDNYDWDYDGFLTATESLFLYNYRDVWGRAWDDWTVHASQMDVAGNLVTRTDPDYPGNLVFGAEDEVADAERLVPFLPTSGQVVGVGIALPADVVASTPAEGIPVRLSRFTTDRVRAGYLVTDAATGAEVEAGELEFAPGQTVAWVPASSLEGVATPRVSIAGSVEAGPIGTRLTGLASVVVVSDEVWIPLGAEWRYLDGDVDPGSTWGATDFDDGEWATGFAQFGFGDGDETTLIDGGPGGGRYTAVYFRSEFQVVGVDRIESLHLRLLRDDGALVLVNGQEVVRDNLPEDEPITHATWASGSTSSESTLREYELDPDVLVEGRNVIAVAVHQSDEDSSDSSFDLELRARPRGDVPPVEDPLIVRGDSNGDGAFDLSDAVEVLLVLFVGKTTTCEDRLDVDDSGTLQITDAIRALEYLFLGGPPPAPPFPEPGVDPTPDELGCEIP